MHTRHGAVLLEVLAALTIFAFSAMSALGLLNQLAVSETRAHTVERTVADQERLLAAYGLLTRDDLDRRLGARAMGAYVVAVQRPTRVLYRVTIGDSTGVELATLLYRPEPRHAP
jgi:type II secretory pathway component PulJ